MDDTAFLNLFNDPSQALGFSVPQTALDPSFEDFFVQLENTEKSFLAATTEDRNQSTQSATNSGNSNAINLLGETKLAEKKLQSLEQPVPQVLQGNASTIYQPQRYSPQDSYFDNRDIIGNAPLRVSLFSPPVPADTQNIFGVTFPDFEFDPSPDEYDSSFKDDFDAFPPIFQSSKLEEDAQRLNDAFFQIFPPLEETNRSVCSDDISTKFDESNCSPAYQFQRSGQNPLRNLRKMISKSTSGSSGGTSANFSPYKSFKSASPHILEEKIFYQNSPALLILNNPNPYLTSENFSNKLTRSEANFFKKLKTDNPYEFLTNLSICNSPFIINNALCSLPEEYCENDEITKRQIDYYNLRNSGSIKNQAMNVVDNGDFQVTVPDLATTESNFNPSPVSDIALQEKMQKLIRNLFIKKVPKGVLELFLNKEHGRDFRDAIKKEIWFQCLNEKRNWFEEVLQNKRWFIAPMKKSKWLRDESSDFQNLFKVLYEIFLKGMNENGEEGSAAANYEELYLLIGNQRFSESDDANKIKEMDNKEFCQKIASSVLAKFLDEGEYFFETWANDVYQPKSNPHLHKHPENILTDEQKRMMYIVCKPYIRERCAHPEKFIDNKKSKNKQNKSEQQGVLSSASTTPIVNL